MANLTPKQIEDSWEIKATQKRPDDRISLAGVPFKIDKDGRKYFVVPRHMEDSAKLLGYEVSEPFNRLIGGVIPGEEEETTGSTNAAVEGDAEVASTGPKVGRPRKTQE